MTAAPITVTMPQILTRKLRERFRDAPHNIELYIFDLPKNRLCAK